MRIHFSSNVLPLLGPIRTWRNAILVPVFVSAAVLFNLIGTTSIGHAEETEVADKAVSSYRIKIRRLQQGILQQEDQIEQTKRKERNILEEIEMLDKKLAEQQAKLSELKIKMATQQALIDREERALTNIRSEKSIVENHLKNRISAYYTMGDIGLLNVTFSTKTLPELLSFHDAFGTLIKYDQDVIKVYRETIKELISAKNTLDLEKTVLEDFIDQTVYETQVMEQTKVEKKSLLTHVRTQVQLHKQAIVEMQQASEDLANSIVSLKSRRTQVYEKGFEADKGNLPPPVDGILITLFQQEKVNKLGISRKSQGIELKAADGTAIVSVSDGDVIFAGYLRGYGNTVIIHHGFQYYTVTSRIEKIFVEKGQRIERESKIGEMGVTATLFDEGLYFEIRHGQQSLDPLLWLNPNRLSVPQEREEIEPPPAVN